MWGIKNTPEHKEVLDLKTGYHIVPLIESESGAEHKLQINVGHDSCPHCGHVKVQEGLDGLDIKKLIADEIALLNANHAKVLAYAKKNRVQVRSEKPR